MALPSPDFVRLADDARSRITEINFTEAARRVATGAILLDIREKEEFSRSHLTGAKHLSRGVLEMRITDVLPDKTTAIVCYCTGGNRSALAADTLQKMGYTNVASLAGGLTAFSEQQKAGKDGSALPGPPQT